MKTEDGAGQTLLHVSTVASKGRSHQRANLIIE